MDPALTAPRVVEGAVEGSGRQFAVGPAFVNDPRFLKTCRIFGFLLPLLAGGNYFVFFEPGAMLAWFSLAAIAFVGLFWSTDRAVPRAATGMDRALLVFLVWSLGIFL